MFWFSLFLYSLKFLYVHEFFTVFFGIILNLPEIFSMKTYLICKGCQQHIKLKGSFSDRWEVVEQYGREIEKPCPFCDHRGKYSVDEVKAEKDSFNTIVVISWIALTVIFLAIVIPFYIREKADIKTLASAIALPAFVSAYLLFWDNKRIRTFNQSRPDSLRSVSFKRNR